jgi:uncharacterized protein
VVEDCVNAVGVDANTASAPLLARVSGIGAGLAQGIVQHRDANGPFKSRKALKAGAAARPKAFEQCAGFLRINGGHDRSMPPACIRRPIRWCRRILEATKSDIKALIGNSEIVRQLKPQAFVDETFGLPTVTDILRELEKPGRDPRPAFKMAALKEGVETIKDLKRGHDPGGHRDQRRGLRRLRRYRRPPGRAGAYLGDVQKFHQGSARGGEARRHRQGEGSDVEAARKRIALTLRLDDEVGAKGDGKAKGATREKPDASPAPRKPAPSSGGALAEALRRCEREGRAWQERRVASGLVKAIEDRRQDSGGKFSVTSCMAASRLA